MHVTAILKDKGRAVECASADISVMDVARRLSARRIGAVVVTAADGSVAGIISERDIIRVLGAHGIQAMDWPVADVMTRRVVTCREHDTVDQLMELMTEHRFRHLPVVENGRLVGIISIGDVVKRRVAEVESEAIAMRDYIAHA
ncbi:MAG: CBS domain-containing protein [Hyphomicrobiaceae bacterium]